MTYQRNISRPRSEQVLDEEVEDRVEGAQVGGRDGDEEDGHRGGLDQRLAVGPLDPLQLRPARDEEAHDPPALPFGRRRLRLLAPLDRLLRAASLLPLGALAVP